MVYVNFVKLPNSLRIEIVPENCQDLEDEFNNNPGWDGDIRMSVAFERELCNGWSWIKPEEIGALTSAPILTDDVVFDDEGVVLEIGAVYYYNEYMTHDPIQELISHGHVIFQKVM